jgi:hypothetical protein
MLSWILLFRAIHLTVVAFFYLVCFAFALWPDTKSYFCYFSKVRFTLKSLLAMFYYIVFFELQSVTELSNFHIWVSVLLVLLDVAEMWSRSYRTYGFRTLRKTIGKAAYFFM